jgi:VWFA-related protein
MHMNGAIRRATIVRVAAIVVLLAGAVTAGQAPPAESQGPAAPNFKLQVDYVELDAFVTDQQGRFVRDLKKEDFQVLEDRRPQTITGFSLVDIPIDRDVRPLFTSRPVEADVMTNARAFDGRIYILVLDDAHVEFQHTPRVAAAARRFIEQNLGANDLMAVVTVEGKAESSQEFTSNKRLLLAAVDKFRGRAQRSATLAGSLQQSLTTAGSRSNTLGSRQPGQAVEDPLDDERALDARATIEQLRAIADWFGSVRGRKKAILLVSEGIDYDVNDVFNRPEAALLIDGTRDLIRSATRSGVTIYGIDPRGITDRGDQGVELSGLAAGSDPRSSRNSGLLGLQNELRLQQSSLRTFAEETGGFAVLNTNGFADAFDRIVQENSSYYVLAYYPPNPKRDGKFHDIQVKVNRPGLTVRARRGYANPDGKLVSGSLDPDGKITAEAREALQSPLPISGLAMRVFAAPFKGTAPNASVLLGVEMRGQDLRLGGGDKLQVTYVAQDARTKERFSSTETMTLNLRPEIKANVQRAGMRTLSRIQIPPGRYQLRVAANDLDTRAVGSVVYDLDVPDFFKSPLAMSGVVLSSGVARKLLTIHADEELKQVLPAPPMGNRIFPVGDELSLFVEIYDNASGSPHKVDIATTVTSDEGTVRLKTEDVRDSSELLGKNGGYGYSSRVPLAGLTLGLYVLKVEARSRLGQEPAANRQVPFRIVAPDSRELSSSLQLSGGLELSSGEGKSK